VFYGVGGENEGYCKQVLIASSPRSTVELWAYSAQSFGANHRENFLVACAKCNNFKKHRFIKKEGSEWVIYSFKK